MSNYSSHVWTIIITVFTFMLAFFVWFFGFNNMKNTMTSDNLQDAVRTSTYLSHDNADRVEPGAFIINKDKFINYLKKTKIKQFGNSTLGDSKDNISVYYLPDRNTSNVKADENGNDHNVSTGYKDKIKNSQNAWVSDKDTTNSRTQQGNGGYEAIRGVRVVVQTNNKSKIVGRQTSDKTNTSNYKANEKANKNRDKFSKFTATDIIQTNSKNKANETDMPNDLTR